MTAATAIQNYIVTISRGILRITPDMAQQIIALAKGDTATGGAYAKLHKYNATNNTYEPQYSVVATDEEIKAAIIAALEKQVPLFYRYDCYNSAGEFEGKIYTINPELF